MFTLSQVIPLGRSFGEYCQMFALSDDDLRASIVACADGPASFNAEATRRGGRVVSCDPLYRFDGEHIQRQIDATFPELMEQARKNAAQFIWGSIPSIEDLARCRREAMHDFLADYEQGKRQRRY